MKKAMKLFIILGLVAGGFAFVSYGVSASPAETNLVELSTVPTQEDGTYSLEDMLVYAILDEYTALATYQAIIDTYGEIRPFTNIVIAEQTHIDLLLPLFETYGITVPVNNVEVVTPDSISSALATGVAGETANIELYQTFLSQNLPDDVRVVFEQLVAASEHHLAVFSKDRYLGAGYDMGQQIKNQFRKMFQNSYQYAGSNGNGQAYRGNK